MNFAADHTRAEKLLLEASRTFNSTLEYEELIERVLRLIIAAAGSEAALVFRVDHERTDMKVRFMNSADFEMKHFYLDVGAGVVGWVTNFREPVVIADASTDQRVDQEIGRLAGVETRSLVSVPLIGKGQMIGVIEAINKQEGQFDSGDMDVLIGLANQIAVAVDNAHLYRMVRREALQKDLLLEICRQLSSSLGLDEVLRMMLDSLKRAVEFDAGGVFLIDADTGDIQTLSTQGYDSASGPKIHLKVGQGLVGSVAKSGRAVIVPDVAVDERYVNSRDDTRSEMVVPIILGDRTIGAINLESDRIAAFTQPQASLVAAFASQAAVSVERARMHERMLSAHKLEEQLHIARKIQRSFLPGANPQIAGYDLCGRNIPSFEVGGDYYDFIKIVESQFGVAIGDVSGKGIPASLIMASFRASLIAEIRNNYAIRTICSKVNNLLCESVQPGNFVTAVYGVLDSKNHVFTFANCGHCLPILIRADGSVEYLSEGGPLLGVSPEAEYEERPVYINASDIIFLYTDGISEVFDPDDNEIELEQLTEVIRENADKSAAEILEAVYRAVTRFAAPQHVYDDLTMIVVKRLSE
ncbi:MAG: SpoIIE family protein phosphatase [candidate division Zixibacteria bacterium]|nr:SpoIIE family protein phosphatase [candidate division Zixibacteria bacterium]MDH3938618.1 SpoIIE family protein phosphatase [candidate division Zixibacteria bacterium]